MFKREQLFHEYIYRFNCLGSNVISKYTCKALRNAQALFIVLSGSRYRSSRLAKSRVFGMTGPSQGLFDTKLKLAWPLTDP